MLPNKTSNLLKLSIALCKQLMPEAMDFDFYALKSYSFAIKKTNNYFSLSTVLLSFAIMALSVIINLNTVQHLWIPRSQLNVQSTMTESFPDTLTTSLVCFKGQDGTAPIARLLGPSLVQIPLKLIDEKTVGLLYPLKKARLGNNFNCLDLSGLSIFNSSHFYYIEIQSSASTLLIDGTSENEILNEVEQDFISFSTQSGAATQIKLTFQNGTIDDGLISSYQTQNLFTFKNMKQYSNNDPQFVKQQNPPLNNQFTYFFLDTYYQIYTFTDPVYNHNIYHLSVTRFKITYILGAVLSWVSILALAVGLVAAPLMDKKLALLTAQTLFNAQQYTKPSLLRFAIASLKKGLFPNEDRFVRMCELLQNMKDVNAIVKLQLLLTRLSPKTNKISAQEPIAAQHSFNTIVLSDCAVPSFHPQSDSFRPQSEQKESVVCKGGRRVRFDASVQLKQVPCWVSLRRSLLHFLDSGSDSVSVTYQKGGIGSWSSVLVGYSFVAGFLLFIILFGVFSPNTVTAVSTSTASTAINYTLGVDELLFMSSSNGSITAWLLDGDLNKVENVPLSTKCAPQGQNTFLSIIYCLSTDLLLSYSMVASQTLTLYLDYSQTTNFYIRFTPKYNSLQKVNVFSDWAPLDTIPSDFSIFYSAPLKVFKVGGRAGWFQAQLKAQTQGTNNKMSPNIHGVVFPIEHGLISVEAESLSVVDVVQNLWSLAMVCFSVILMKVTKYINLRARLSQSSQEKIQFRDSICILLAKMHAMKEGRLKSELDASRFYLKQQLQQ